MAENQTFSFADSIAEGRQRLASELRAQSEQIQKLNLELTELQTLHERTQSEASRQWDAVAAAAAAMKPQVSADTVLENVLGAVRGLMTCTIPEQVMLTLTEEASQWGVRAAIFDVRGRSAWGASAHGFGPALKDNVFRSLIIQLGQDNPFRQVCETAGDVETSVEALRKNRNVLDKLKPPAHCAILLLPIRSAGTVTAIFYADPGESGDPLPVSALKILAEFAGAQIDRLIALSGGFAEGASPEPIHEPEGIQSPAAEPPGEPAAEETSVESHEDGESAVEAQAVEPVLVEQAFEASAGEAVAAESHPEIEVESPQSPGGILPAEMAVAALETPAQPEEIDLEFPPPVVKPRMDPLSRSSEITEEFPLPPEVLAFQSHTSVTEAAAEAPQAVQPGLENETDSAAGKHSGEFVDSSTSLAPPPSLLVEESPAAAPVASAHFDVSQLSEADQKVHKDARRFAKLLVSEIELYNKAKVAEGRKNEDLYKRLKSDIDRSRLTFEKRFGKALSRQVDYFHDELVKILAENDSALLGPEYPGPSA